MAVYPDLATGVAEIDATIRNKTADKSITPGQHSDVLTRVLETALQRTGSVFDPITRTNSTLNSAPTLTELGVTSYASVPDNYAVWVSLAGGTKELWVTPFGSDANLTLSGGGSVNAGAAPADTVGSDEDYWFVTSGDAYGMLLYKDSGSWGYHAQFDFDFLQAPIAEGTARAVAIAALLPAATDAYRYIVQEGTFAGHWQVEKTGAGVQLSSFNSINIDGSNGTGITPDTGWSLPTNTTTVKSFDADNASLQEIADAVATLINAGFNNGTLTA